MEGSCKRSRSLVWNYFDLVSPSKVKCMICDKQLAFSSNTSSMLRHLRSTHPGVTEEYDNPAVSAHTGTSKQGRQEELDEALVDMVIKDLQPFSTVEDKGFKAFVNKLDPSYILPTRKALKAMVQAKYCAAKEKAMAEVKQATYVSLTSDMWTSINMDGYLGVTCHYVTAEAKLATVLLCVSQFPQTHTAAHITESMSGLMTDWGISGKIHCMVTDNAANLVATAQLLKVRHVPCFAHTLNLVVKKAIDQTPKLQVIRQKARKIVSLFRSSCNAKEKLSEMQQLMGRPVQKVVQEVDTRWNSTYDMLQRLYDQREAVGAALSNLNTEVVPLTSGEYDIISECLTLLLPLKHATAEMSAEKMVSASKMIPLYRMLQHTISEKSTKVTREESIQLGVHLKESLRSRFHTLESTRVLALATLLDPRFKTIGFGNPDRVREAERQLTLECASLMRSSPDTVHVTPQEPQPSTSALAPSLEAACPTDNLWQLLDLRVSEAQRVHSATADATVEVQRYLMDAYLGRQEDPLLYWKERITVYPSLYQLAIKYLCLPATSVPSERIFSKAGEVLCKKRSRLKPSTAEQIIFLNKND
ncbi:E3 SUMO-protein ligase ZBED1-like [Polypterus senegalus]|uniref:E3 SUMO-protein ligase ZBED1-like n=1 Tax=Polypterus senegalus TaxID=55291 RepID=UPI0019634F7E|nr:E3 SUMO-protein ligase ZBED1-like [Polypterus senegalus]